MDCGLPPLSMGDFAGKSPGVGWHFLLQGIFPIQGSNPGLPHCRQTLYHLSHQGSPRDLFKSCIIDLFKRWQALCILLKPHRRSWKIWLQSGIVAEFLTVLYVCVAFFFWAIDLFGGLGEAIDPPILRIMFLNGNSVYIKCICIFDENMLRDCKENQLYWNIIFNVLKEQIQEIVISMFLY